MPYIAAPAARPVYRAAALFVQRALRTTGSLFVGRCRVWTMPALADLDARLSAATATGESFAQRWGHRLEHAECLTVQLAAEVLYVHLLFASDLTGANKRRLIEGTLACAEDGLVRAPPALDAALDAGLARTGVAFKLRRESQLRLLVGAARALHDQPAADRRAQLADPYAFKRRLETVAHDGAAAQREALLHLVFPETFEPIVSPTVKRQIADAFAELVPDGVDDTDRALAAIRAALEPELGPAFQFIDIVDRWRPN